MYISIVMFVDSAWFVVSCCRVFIVLPILLSHFLYLKVFTEE